MHACQIEIKEILHLNIYTFSLILALTGGVPWVHFWIPPQCENMGAEKGQKLRYFNLPSNMSDMPLQSSDKNINILSASVNAGKFKIVLSKLPTTLPGFSE